MSVRSVFANAKEHRDFAAGEAIFREGDAGREMFGLVSGRVELRHGDEVVLSIEPGGTFGEMAIISETPRSLTAVAVDPSRIAVITRHTFLFLVHETPMFAIDVMRALVQRIHDYERER
jgi:CRP/FNR family transcriptional regulator, cyclic AMP receptor protein